MVRRPPQVVRNSPQVAWQAAKSAPASGGAHPATKPDCSIQLSHSRAVSHPPSWRIIVLPMCPNTCYPSLRSVQSSPQGERKNLSLSPPPAAVPLSFVPPSSVGTCQDMSLQAGSSTCEERVGVSSNCTAARFTRSRAVNHPPS
jgi:hypothetical protein